MARGISGGRGRSKKEWTEIIGGIDTRICRVDEGMGGDREWRRGRYACPRGVKTKRSKEPSSTYCGKS